MIFLTLMMMLGHHQPKCEDTPLIRNYTPKPAVTRLYRDESNEKLKWTVEGEVGGLNDVEVAQCIIDVAYNRLDSGQFGSNMDEILSVKQFNGVNNYYTKRNKPSKRVVEAMSDIKGARGKAKGALYFCSYDDLSSSSKKWFDSLEFICEIKGMRFYK